MLLRHARAGWATPGMRDFDRPLTPAGIAECQRVGARMAAGGWQPVRVLCSGAARTRETLDRVRQRLPGEIGEVTFLDELYDSDATGYVALIAAHMGAGPLLVIGHNPMMEDLVTALPSQTHGEADPLPHGGFPTAGLAVLSFDGPVAPGKGRLLAFLDGAD